MPMRRLEVELSEQAIADLEAIFIFIFDRTRSARVADGFVNRIEARCMKIGEVPHGGRARDDLAPGTRTVPFERTALIAYRIEDERVVITNVFYRGRDAEAAFSDGD